MIPQNPANHRAHLDSEGNIILPNFEGCSTHEEDVGFQERIMQEGEWYSPVMERNEVNDFDLSRTELEFENDSEQVVFSEKSDAVYYDPIAAMLSSKEESPEESTQSLIESASYVWNNVRGQVYAVTNEFILEGGHQYTSSVKGGLNVSRGALGACSNGMKRFWKFLTQPVWVPGRNNEPKQYGRGVLFVLDIVRFGGTFASLFVVLFVSLNFQSFWTIAHSYVDPLTEVTSGKHFVSEKDFGIAEKLKKIPSLATAGAAGDMTAYLPEVGPPDDRLIIPKMNLNIPIVIPPNTSLMKEDWKGLEEDIQLGLQEGVVHYPGTARPGQAGNFFVTGHSSYFPWAPGKYKSVFARLPELKIGDEYWVYYSGDKYRYVITEKKEISPSDVSVLDQPFNKRMGSLMTCTPIGTTLRRLVISAQEVDTLTGVPVAVGERSREILSPLTKMEMLPI